MIEICIIILIAVVIGTIIGVLLSNDFAIRVYCCFALCIACITIGLLCAESVYSRKPSAIDVYRNNTQLKIYTITEDSVIIKSDTTVVWKNKT